MSITDKFTVWFKGNQEAVQFADTLWRAAQEWDDLEDEGACNHNALIAWMAFGKEYTPFFAQNQAILRPAMLTMYLQWRCANELDRGPLADVEKAFMLRAGIYTVFVLIAFVVGGDEWAVEVGPDIYRTYGETVASLYKEFHGA